MIVGVTDKQESVGVARAASVEVTSDPLVYQTKHTVDVRAAEAGGTAEGDVKEWNVL